MNSRWIFETISSNGTNPQNSGIVKVEGTQQNSNFKGLTTLTVWGNSVAAVSINTIPNSFYSFDFIKSIKISKYRLRTSNGFAFPTNWKMICTNRNINTTISNIDKGLCNTLTTYKGCGESVMTKEYQTSERICKKLTIMLTTKNSADNWEFTLTGIDVYGEFATAIYLSCHSQCNKLFYLKIALISIIIT